ncbi:MAG: aminoacyl-tRNA hydrolase [Deltaproteobacteria bacterium]|nr:MAG: aminoacyl-tRNA hydrolase [Deltaproteobacteria bacterium]
MELFVISGLGNPGPRYSGTIHNAGFEVVDRLAGRAAARTWSERFGALVAEANHEGRRLLLVKPQSFMNLSGGPVSRIVDYFRPDRRRVMVVHDDVDLSCGRIMLKWNGGAGGHKGVASIMEALGPDFCRLRVGVGRPPNGLDAAEYVLRRPSPEAAELLRHAFERACDALECWISNGLERAMSVFNRWPPAEE